MVLEVEHSASNMSNNVDDEARIEMLLSEKLMQGYVLLEKSCPVCATPLVKKNPVDEEEAENDAPVAPVMVPSGSFDKPFRVVEGVPFCVGCTSHVITQECEISILERCDSLKAKGSILVALQDGSYTEGSPSQYTSSANDDKPEEAATNSEATSREESTEPSHVIDVTDFSEPSTSYLEEKKEEDHSTFESQKSDEMMIEYSVRYVVRSRRTKRKTDVF